MRRVASIASVLGFALACAGTASADTIKLGHISQQLGPSRAAVRASISTQEEIRGRAASRGVRRDAPAASQSTVAQPQTIGGAGGDLRPVLPTLASDSALLRNPQPFGPGTFWYQGGAGQACVYAANASPLCYMVTGPARPAVNPALIASTIADRLELGPGRVEASPAPNAHGLTGAASWFWLSPAPRTQELTVALAGERVAVSAEPAIEWRFGDGTTLAGGAGVPYGAGSPPPEAITHLYETRCLPGDQGRNPHVLASCAMNGYAVEAVVSWRITYRSSGPVAASGTLPSRTTETSLAYPVGEARAFLVGGGSQ